MSKQLIERLLRHAGNKESEAARDIREAADLIAELEAQFINAYCNQCSCWEKRIAELEADRLCRCADEVRCDYLKRIAELEEQVHQCEDCGEYCNQCSCWEKRIAELEGARRRE